MAAMSAAERNAKRRELWASMTEAEREREREKDRERRQRWREQHPEEYAARVKRRAQQLHEKYLEDPEEHEKKNTYERERYRAKRGLTG